MSGERVVEVTRRGAVATVTIRRPEVHNAFDEHVIAQLAEALTALRTDSGTRAVVLTGEGRSFSAGADLDWMRRASSFTESENRRDAAALAAMLRGIADSPIPVIAKVQGGTFGGGAGLVAVADIAVAAESTRFGFTEVRLGLVPATIAPHVVEKIGPSNARRFFLTGDRFDAAEARSIGLVHLVAPDDELGSVVDGLVAAILAGGPDAQRICKELIRNMRANNAEVDSYTASLIAAVRSGTEGREGVAAFLEKRPPDWAVVDDDS
jgi:methylglutaconyl-CoA hydratase